MRIPITDAQLEENPYLPPYYNPGEDDEAIQYLHERRRALGGYVPERRTKYTQLNLPDDSAYAIAKKGSGTQEIATTMAFVRLLKDLLRSKDFGHRIVPIIPDEARTFGMDAFFPNAKIYNPNGQHYTSVDRELLLAYKESPQGQIIHVGINEAGALAAFTNVGTSYSTQGEPLIPVYVFYSMFGFQRTGDAMWAAGDQMARGFIIGATAGRTTLTGEGLQHADGHSLAARVDEPGRRLVRPRLRLRDRPHRARRPRADVRRQAPRPERHVLPHGLQRADRAAGGARGRRRRRHRPRHLQAPRRHDVDGPKAQLLASGVSVPWALEAQHLLAAGLGRLRRCVERHLAGPSCAATASRPRSTTSSTRSRRRRCRTSRASCRAPRVRSSRSPTTCTRCPTRSVSSCPASTRRWAPTTSASRTPAPPPAASSRSTDRRWWSARSSCSPRRARSTANAPAWAIEKYLLHDVNAGTTGSAGGES